MKRNQKNRWILAILALAMVLMTPACTSPSAGSDPTTGGADTKTAEPSKAPEESKAAESTAPDAGASTGADTSEFVEFDWYLGLDPMPDNQMVNDALNEYLKDKINAKVNIKYWTSKDWETKMPTMISSGQDMGIIGFGSQSKLDYVINAKKGAFYPIEDMLGTIGTGTKALFGQAVWDCMTIDGHIYGIPSLKDNCYIISVIYNADMAEALGIDMEKDMDYYNWRNIEPFLMDVVQKRHEKFPEYDQYPLCGGAGTEMPYNFGIESFLNDSFMAVCNIDGIDDVKGYDSNTVFNLYATDEYREFAKSRVRMVEANVFAYDYEGKTEWNYTGGMFAWPGWGYAYMQDHLYDESFTTKMVVSKNIWTDTNNYFSAGTAISANAKNPERAMMLLELVNNDPFVATMMRFGIEGEHYVKDAEGKMTLEGSKRNDVAAERGYYYWYAAPVGNLTIVDAPESLTGPDGIMLDRIVEYNNSATIPSHMGFVFDIAPVSNEIAACTNVVMEYRDNLRNGKLGSEAEVDKAVDEFNAKLTNNGVDKIVAEVQKQIDAWNAAK